jgi:hypothetical protein
MAAATIAIEVQAAAIKKAFEDALLDLAIEAAPNNLYTLLALACSAAFAVAEGYLGCVKACGNLDWSCGNRTNNTSSKTGS